MDEPSPTIVGPQPAQSEAGRRPRTPCGLERLLALACLGPEWREKVLANPLGAAEEAKLALSESERGVLRSVRRASLEPMIESFSRRSAEVKPDLPRTASWAAAAALLASSLSGCDKLQSLLSPTLTAGILEDQPPEKAGPAVPRGIMADEPQAKERQGKTEQKGDRLPLSPERFPAPGGALGDEPPERGRPERDRPGDDRIMVVPPGQPGNAGGPAGRDKAGAPPAQAPSEEEPERTRGIRGDLPRSRSEP